MSGMAGNAPGSTESGLQPAPPWPLELDPGSVRERLRWARHRGHPRYLWPEVEPAAWREALRSIEAVTRNILGGRTATLAAPDARALGIAAFTSGTGPLLGYWIERGQLDVSEPARALLLIHLRHGRVRAHKQHAILGRVLAALRDHDVEPAVLKSAATGPLYFPEPGVRPAVDIDLVVPGADFDSAERALVASGHERAGHQASPRKSDWRVPGTQPWPRSLELLHAGGQYAIDLHESLTRDFFGVRRVTIEGDTQPANLAGTAGRVLAQPALLAFHALHAAEGLDNLTLIRLVEIVLMIRRDAGRTLDWNALLDLLERSGGDCFAWPAFALSERLVPGTVDPKVLHTLEQAATPAMRRVIADLAPAAATRLDVLTLKERFIWCRTPADYARRLLHMMLPAPAGRSPTRLAALYADRAWRLLRGNVEVGRSDPRDSHR